MIDRIVGIKQNPKIIPIMSFRLIINLLSPILKFYLFVYDTSWRR